MFMFVLLRKRVGNPLRVKRTSADHVENPFLCAQSVTKRVGNTSVVASAHLQQGGELRNCEIQNSPAGTEK